MKILPLHLLLASAATFSIQAAPLPPAYEETFNTPHERLRLVNGANLGGPHTGVSGKLDDQAYIGRPLTSEQAKDGPAAYALSPIMPNSTSTLTWTLWYCLEDQGPSPDLQLMVDAAGAALLFHYSDGLEMRVGCGPEEPRIYHFGVGPRGPLLDWTKTGRWIFIAVTWEQATNSLAVYQGTAETPVTFHRTIQRQLPGKPSTPRANLDRSPETIGNSYGKRDRPLAGRLDNFRFYYVVLAIDQLEQIRQADIENRAVALKPESRG